MTTSSIPALEAAIEKTNVWIGELAKDFDGDYHSALQALRACLHALRDRMTVEEASDLAAQLPLVIRGIYYEGWNPSRVPTKERDLESFLERVGSETGSGSTVEPEQAVRSVFRVLSEHCTPGQVRHVRSCLPQEFQSLWP